MRQHDAGIETRWAQALIAAREKLGLRQARVAERIGVARVNLCHWENFRSTPSTFRLWNRWARAVGMGPVIAAPPPPVVDDGED